MLFKDYTVLHPPSLHHPTRFSHARGRKSFWIILPRFQPSFGYWLQFCQQLWICYL